MADRGAFGSPRYREGSTSNLAASAGNPSMWIFLLLFFSAIYYMRPVPGTVLLLLRLDIIDLATVSLIG